MAVITGDEKALTAAPGVGKKARPAHPSGIEGQDRQRKRRRSACRPRPAVRRSAAGARRREAAAALAVLGYTQQDISAALKGVDVENLPLEEIMRQSLKKW